MLPVVLYEPPYASRFWPLSDFYPLWELRCGAFTFVERLKRYLDGFEILLLPRPELTEVAGSMQPGMKVISSDNLPDEAIFISASLLASPSFDFMDTAASGENPHCKRMTRGAFPEILSTNLHDIPCGCEDEGFIVLSEVWHLVQHLQTALNWDIGYVASTSSDEYLGEYRDSNAFISD